MKNGLCHEYPLRPDFDAQLVLPRDLTALEARRLCAMIETLVVSTLHDDLIFDEDDPPPDIGKPIQTPTEIDTMDDYVMPDDSPAYEPKCAKEADDADSRR